MDSRKMRDEVLALLERELDMVLALQQRPTLSLTREEILRLMRHSAGNIAMMYAYRTTEEEPTL
jgi:hypothetical protein